MVSVSERTREIGLLKAVGVTRSQVIAVFLVEAAILANGRRMPWLLGGFVSGQVLQQLYPDFPYQTPAWAIPAAPSCVMLGRLIFGIVPASRAAQLDPVAALMRRKA